MSGECQVNVKSQSELDIGGRETCFNLSDSSLHFFLQSGLPAEQRRMSLLNNFQNLSYKMFDFYADAGPQTDGDNFVAKVQRRDIAMLGKFVCRLCHLG